MKESFVNEARLESKRHPNLVDVDAFPESHGFPFKFMEYVEGGSLKQRLKQSNRLRPERALEIVEDVARALAWDNENEDSRIVHRDIKPANILLTEDGQAKLTDFGLAKLDRDDPGASLANSQQQPSTLHYMSPEQAEGRSTLTPKSDMFALGVVLYEMLTGEHPFHGEDDAESSSSRTSSRRRCPSATKRFRQPYATCSARC
jgi:serine/threonine-protein kinase